MYKPAFTSYCIYYDIILQLESNKPFGDDNYYKERRIELKNDSKEIIQYISYYRIKEASKDQEYFVEIQIERISLPS
ncbi:MAG: RteC domain-containing protein [Saprospiraceae bacterium]|nr:RteC domain-containing protein [Saprospiraceae bacterium]